MDVLAYTLVPGMCLMDNRRQMPKIVCKLDNQILTYSISFKKRTDCESQSEKYHRSVNFYFIDESEPSLVIVSEEKRDFLFSKYIIPQ